MIHLVHPALVHFPIALLMVGGVTEAIGLLADRSGARRIGGVLVIGGTVALIPTIASGYLAANSIPLDEPALRHLALHEWTGWLVLAWFLGCLFAQAWTRGRMVGAARCVLAAALLIGVLLTGGAAFLGGELVFGHGAGVARPEPASGGPLSLAEEPP
jgi:uncharacterized membrane protein